MFILIACEESQRVCMAFRAKGHDAYSCDIQECSGGHPEWHIQSDVRPLLNGDCTFRTMNGSIHKLYGKWNMIIAHPPCTDLAISGARHFDEKRKNGTQQKSIEFFLAMLNAECDKIAVENPVNIISGSYMQKWYPDLCSKFDLPKKPTQYIHPFMFGDSARKKTGLWLKNLPCLIPTKIVDPGLIDSYGFSINAGLNFCRDENGKILSWNDPLTSKIRSKTFPGIAEAMSEQWG